MANKRVLIVDDEPDIVDLIEFNLKLENIECIKAYDGEQGLFQAKHAKPDLILLDIMLPKMNGYEIARALRADESCKDIPIVMLTARTQQGDIILGKEAGADEYVPKPFAMDELVGVILDFFK
jgi:DNA-binding response OmpR family regulator